MSTSKNKEHTFSLKQEEVTGQAGPSSPGEEVSRAPGPFSRSGVRKNACSRRLLQHKARQIGLKRLHSWRETQGYLRVGFLHLSHTDVGAGLLFIVRAVLCTAGCLVVSLVSTH